MRGGGSKAVWNFSENSSVLVVPSVPKDQTHSSDTDRHWQTGRQTLSAVIFQSGNYLFKKSDFGPAFNDLSSFWKLLLNFLNVVFVFRLELDKDTGNRCTASPGENMVTPRRRRCRKIFAFAGFCSSCVLVVIRIPWLWANLCLVFRKLIYVQNITQSGGTRYQMFAFAGFCSSSSVLSAVEEWLEGVSKD